MSLSSFKNILNVLLLLKISEVTIINFLFINDI